MHVWKMNIYRIEATRRHQNLRVASILYISIFQACMVKYKLHAAKLVNYVLCHDALGKNDGSKGKIVAFYCLFYLFLP